MSITKLLSGGISISTVHNGYFRQKTYFGYSIKEAKKLFSQWLKS